MVPVATIPDLASAELADHAFGCLEGCGFCCTFSPELNQRELARLRARLAPKPVPVGVGPDGRSYLQLQNKCGGCTLLERRGCTQYDLRPAHCRYFPFHVHFAQRPEAYLNYACRGVERSAGGDVSQAFRTSVLENTAEAEVTKHIEQARRTYGEFERRARRAKAWGDAEAVVAEALDAGPAAFTAEWVEQAARRADEPLAADEMATDALLPFQTQDATKGPFWLTADLAWITFARDGGDLIEQEMDEKGHLRERRRLEAPRGWREPPAEVAQGLADYLARLARRSLLVGSAYALVDDADYTTTVEEATWWRLAEIVSDLGVRAEVLARAGVPAERLADETARFYDSSFLDAPTIGGFL